MIAVHNASGNFEQRPLPSFVEHRALLDASLVEEASARVDDEQMQLRRVLGVA